MNLPEKKSSGDSLWLFTKVMVFLLASGLVLMCGVVLSVWVGGMVLISTENKAFAVMAAIAALMASGAGRSWFHSFIVPRMFSAKDVQTMSDVIGGKNSGR